MWALFLTSIMFEGWILDLWELYVSSRETYEGDDYIRINSVGCSFLNIVMERLIHTLGSKKLYHLEDLRGIFDVLA